ncbi:PX domain containing protein [Pyrenophora tritici-repentis]|uniref:Endosomal/vacuolar adapter protein YPT35 n=2 Tax=Pyrenophora tritici-repentis TaxID=45151 RepID=A0A5M9KZX6_9PLEO|nr:PX domain containing protein [Pyrenophora tritici-repentis Pt-1C-BFP]KAA8617210.1 PX domain-containing protein [Pyrenophora tritici-repentis]EDU46095.1 PX domain containing protein [Pyrenophora tritici-repentis Pt-1C-BFP]KAG9382189.1 PX domain containing protein [Pyrenophora tritici-repentis]KAI1508011.1 PX domain containing protein [Pyrenophora tritici-repentis]KAI1678173.1 PX domain containing protein [Pyrenophora tritici-repentis]
MEPARFETGASSSSPSPARHDGAKAATALQDDGTRVDVVSPPYWQQQHQRHSYLSTYSADGHPTPISLEDHTDEGSDHCKVLWAKGVTIDDYVVVSGSAPGLGAYVVWNCTVETLDGGPMKIRKRYSEFEDLHTKLLKTFPDAAASLPQFPPKSVISRFRPRFLEKRKHGLSYFLKCVAIDNTPLAYISTDSKNSCVLLNPQFAGSPVLKDFLFS